MKSISYYLFMGRGPGRNKHGSGGTMTRSEKAARRKETKTKVKSDVPEHVAPETDQELVDLKRETLLKLEEASYRLNRTAFEQREYGERVGIPSITNGIEDIEYNINRAKNSLADISDSLRQAEQSPTIQADILDTIVNLERNLDVTNELQSDLIGNDPSINASRFTRDLEDTTVYIKKALEEVKNNLEENEGGNSYFKEFLPTSKRDYYQDLHNKHFDPSTAVGSVFTKASDIEDLLEIADREEGGIRRDDRDKFIAEGADPDGFLPQCRYVKVETAGEDGILPVSECDKDEKVHVVRTKVGAPCSLVIERSSRPKTNSATIIFGPDPESGNEIVWTAHPGAPIRPSSGDSWDEGSTITVQDVIDTSGKGAWLQVEVS